MVKHNLILEFWNDFSLCIRKLGELYSSFHSYWKQNCQQNRIPFKFKLNENIIYTLAERKTAGSY